MMTLSERIALLDQRLALGEQYSEAGKRAARIMDRVLPKPGVGRSAFHDPDGFVADARRHGERSALYRAIYPRVLAKVKARAAATVGAVMAAPRIAA